MMIVIAIMGILTALGLAAINAAYQQSRVQRTQSIIAKIDSLITDKYESYRTRPVPIRIPPNMRDPNVAAALRLNAMRELMRLEMPDRQSDIMDVPGYPNAWVPAYVTLPSLTKNYRRRANQQAHQPGNPALTGIGYWTDANENAECLYLILASMRDGDKSALDFFSPSEIGDVDDDGMNEVLDSFGQPIAFLRWAPAYRSDIAPFPVTPQSLADPDPFDPMKVDPRWQGANFTPFALKPLVWSPGADKKHDINVATPRDGSNIAIPYGFSGNSPRNDPFFTDTNTGMPVVGAPADTNGDGYPDYSDNITNHDLEAR